MAPRHSKGLSSQKRYTVNIVDPITVSLKQSYSWSTCDVKADSEVARPALEA